MDQPTNWWSPEFGHLQDSPSAKTTAVDDVHLMQPIGFVWFRKPRYRVKATSRTV